MAKTKTTCNLCGETSKSADVLTLCPMCNANLDGPQKETVLKQTECITNESGTGVTAQKGTLFLTNRRIFWIRRAARLAGGIANAFLGSSKQMKFSFALDEIADAQLAKLGPFKQLKITTTGGEIVVLDIKSKEIQDWIDAINAAKERH